MSLEVITILIGLAGVIIGAIPTYLFMYKKGTAEVANLEAETDKFRAEAEKFRNDLQTSERDKSQTVNHLQSAYNLLLIPGYDLSLIVEILENFDRTGNINSSVIAKPRQLTPSTIPNIVNSMNVHKYIRPQGGNLTLTNKGRELLVYLQSADTQ